VLPTPVANPESNKPKLPNASPLSAISAVNPPPRENCAESPKTPLGPHLLLISSYVLAVSIFQANLFGSKKEEEDVLSSCLASKGNEKRKNSLLKTLDHVTANKATKINMK
jgi:hypothetical protein